MKPKKKAKFSVRAYKTPNCQESEVVMETFDIHEAVDKQIELRESRKYFAVHLTGTYVPVSEIGG